MSFGVIRKMETQVKNGQQRDVRGLFVECGVCIGHYKCSPTFNFYVVKKSERYNNQEYWCCDFCIEDELRLLGKTADLEYVQSRKITRT